MRELIDALWRLPRDLVSDGYDRALAALAAQVPMTIHEYPSGRECWTWIIPNAWNCRAARLETLDGRRLFSTEDHPLHVVSYSQPFTGEVGREALFAHLHVHPTLPEAIPYRYAFYERAWGLCCSRRQRTALTDARYRVTIDVDERPGMLKVGEVIHPGRSEQSFVLCAHLDHPAMVNDDLSGVVVGLEVMRRLRRRRTRYTYRFLILPETIGSAAYLSHHEALIPSMLGGLFLEMLGLDAPAALQRSYTESSAVDRCFERAFTAHCPEGWIGAFRRVIGNDERQFNAPGVRVPMLSLSRVLPRSSPDWPYPEYHSSLDTPALASDRRLEESVQLVLAMIDAWEAEVIPQPRFRGEVFLSRYGLFVDLWRDPAKHQALFDVMFELDGTASLADIARTVGRPAAEVDQLARALARHGLITLPEAR
jgi:aminopeptidase-like protein